MKPCLIELIYTSVAGMFD